ncbi:LAMI_0C04302g1_1 [Lachancea mirantina]|uniref:Peroxin-3 n=1 Tax=Lachancea mirantina TaxID=1230905 RepID=A0A1G4J2A8_9SACH|nr:LAMI_0C04302g1_1 [Lachancea mirantina]
MSRQGLWQRHRAKFLFSSAIVASLVASGAVTILLIKKWLYRQQLKISEQHFVKEQIKRRFTQTQQDALYTIYELVPVLSLVLAKDLDVEEVVAALKDKKLARKLSNGGRGDTGAGTCRSEHDDGLSSGMSTNVTESRGADMRNAENRESQEPASNKGKTKAELWNELKIKSLAKLCTLVYTVASLLLLTRLQLNILARREYLDTAVKMAVEKEAATHSVLPEWLSRLWPSTVSDAEQETSAVDPESEKDAKKTNYINEQAFLSLSWWVLNRGWLQFKAIATEQTERQFGNLSPRDTLSVEEFADRLSHVFHAMNQSLITNADNGNQVGSILLPDSTLEQFVLQQTLDQDALKTLYDDNSILRQLINETTKCLQSTVSLIVLESLVNTAFQYIMSEIDQGVTKKVKKPHAEAEISEEPSKFQIALFSIASKDCSEEMLKSGVVSMNNAFLQRLDSVPELDDLSASVYSNFGF